MYQEFTRFTDELISQGMDGVIGGGIGASMGYMRSALMLYVLIAAVLVMANKLDLWDTIRRGVRAMAIIAVLQASTYNSLVRETFWTTIPNATASGVAGGQVSITAAERFDRVDRAAEHSVALVDARLSFYTVRANFSVGFAQAVMKLCLGLSYALWLAARIATAVLICAGAFLLIAYLFDATRGWVMGWLGNLVGLAIWALANAILIELVLAGSLFWAQRTAANANAGIFEATDALWKLAIWFAICALVMLALPAFAAVRSGAAAGTVLAGNAVLGAATGGSRLAGGAIRSGAAAVRGGARASVRA